MKSAKTLLVTEIFPPTCGGSGRWFIELYSRLPQGEYIVAAGKCEGDEGFDRNTVLDVQRIDLSSPSWGIRSFIGLKFYFKTFLTIRRLIKQHSITQLHCGRCLPEGVFGYLFHKILGLPYTCFIHGEDVEAASSSRELSFIVRKVLANSSLLICNSENSKNILLNEWQCDEGKVKVLHPGVDASRFVPAPKDLSFIKSMDWGNRFVILTVGRLQKRKGQDVLIRALPLLIKEMPKVLYCIVGGGDQLIELKRLVDELGLKKYVQFLSEISDEKIIECYQQCNLFALPNRTVGKDIEGFGMVLVEAQSCAKPVLAGDSGGTSETMVVGETGVIADCRSPESLSKAILKLCADRDGLIRMGAEGRDHVVTNLDWAAHVKKAQIHFRTDIEPK